MTEPRDEHRRSPLESDVVLPAQYFTRFRGRAEGEQRLLLAVLEEAVDCYQKYAFAHDLRGQRLFHEVTEWMLSGDKEPFSFQYICDVLGLDPGYLREGLERWRERASAGAHARAASPVGSRRFAHERSSRSARRHAHFTRPILLRRATLKQFV